MRLALLPLLLLADPTPPEESGLVLAATLDEARSLAAAEKRPVLVLFSNAAVPSSQEMGRALQADRRVAEMKAALVLVDPFDRGKGTEVARRYNVRAVPSLLVLGSDGQEIDRIEDAPPARELGRAIEDLLAGKGTLARLRAREKERPDDLETALQLGRELMSRGDETGAKSRFALVAGKDPDHRAPQLAGRALYDLGLLALRREDLEEARRRLGAVIDGYPGSPAAIDAELCLAQLLAIDGQPADAVRALERFRMSHPNHPRDARAAELLDRLRGTPRD